MDMHFLVKMAHMLGITLAFVILILRATTLFMGTQGQQPSQNKRKFYVATQHFSFTLVLLTGISLLVMNDLKVQSWFYAKIVLFIVIISSLIKAYKQDDSILLIQRKAGVLISLIAFIAIIALIIIKPVF